ncbi:MAG: SGNH/GDSL hydrolase family protein [Chloroflexi bacterium]|nr:SGNH/GDSL hydrolase family protein [Chloroflexota bacterium]
MNDNTSKTNLWRLLIKAVILFILFNLIFAFSSPQQILGKLSVYNSLVPGRERLPFGENPAEAYNLSLYNLEAMFSSHEISGIDKSENEFRVFLIGDSSTWGFYLENEDTLSNILNRSELETAEGKDIEFYNFGYPTISLTKDLMILDRVLEYQPNLIIWLVTLESFPYEKQIFTPLVQQNPEFVKPLIEQYSINIDPNSELFINETFWEKTIIGQRRQIADVLRLQFYAPLWAATGIDQYIPDEYKLRAEDLDPIDDYYGFAPPTLSRNDLAFDVMSAGIEHADQIPVLIVNEPIFVSQGENSDIRYDFFYPRWAYDSYRQLLATETEDNGWAYIMLYALESRG